MELIGENIKSSGLSDFKDPFNKECVREIFFFVRKEFCGNKGIQYDSTVYFKNGNTKGEQNIKADDFVSLVKKTEDFVKSLENK